MSDKSSMLPNQALLPTSVSPSPKPVSVAPSQRPISPSHPFKTERFRKMLMRLRNEGFVLVSYSPFIMRCEAFLSPEQCKDIITAAEGRYSDSLLFGGRLDKATRSSFSATVLIPHAHMQFIKNKISRIVDDPKLSLVRSVLCSALCRVSRVLNHTVMNRSPRKLCATAKANTTSLTTTRRHRKQTVSSGPSRSSLISTPSGSSARVRSLCSLVCRFHRSAEAGGATTFVNTKPLHREQPTAGTCLFWANWKESTELDDATEHKAEQILLSGVIKYALNLWITPLEKPFVF